MATKPELRKLMGSVIAKISEEDRLSQSTKVAQKVLTHPRYLDAKNVSMYLSTHNEIDTISILQCAIEQDKKRCFIPYIPKISSGSSQIKARKPRMHMIEITSMKEYDELPINKYGIKEPIDASVNNSIEDDGCINLDLIIVPGVAFASDGRRLGHGKGYYDEFLKCLSLVHSRKPSTIGLALRQQMIDDPLSIDDHDYVLDEVITC